MQPPLLLLRLRVGVASPVKPHRLLPNSPSLPRCRCRCRRSWFSNAEPGASNTRSRSRSRRWWSDADDQLEDDEFDEFGGAAGELFDEPWFSKVFKAYGYVLPVILASMLVATGPQAFLMAMAIPLAQSAISFALRTLSTASSYSDYADDFEASSYSDYADEFEAYSYRDSSSSWSPEPAGDASSSSNTKTQSAGFGGWDELDGDEHHGRSRSSSTSNADAASASASSSSAASPTASASSVRRRRRRRMRPTSASRMGNSRYRQAPLMMRLLVAVFPFLGSWFRML